MIRATRLEVSMGEDIVGGRAVGGGGGGSGGGGDDELSASRGLEARSMVGGDVCV